MIRSFGSVVVAALLLIFSSYTCVPAFAQQAPAAAEKPPMKAEELEQLLAPVALYPDSLLSQILMASTYPVEVVQAARWAKQNASLKGDALTTELEKQAWDPSVKSLVNFPELLQGMSDKLDQTVKLGDAFLADQKRVLDTVQVLRARAQKAGNLKSSEQQTVTVEPQSGSSSQVIVIEPSNPEVVYLPAYDPVVVYGAWPYPTYPPPPAYYYPPNYVATAAVSFGVGLAVGAAWGYAWGGCDWHHGDVDVDINRNTNINNNINRNNYQGNFQRNNNNFQGGKGNWQHNPEHRQGAAYRDQSVANRYGGGRPADQQVARDAYRGRADAGRQELARSGNRPTAGQTPAGGAGARTGAIDNRMPDNRVNQPGAANRAGSGSGANRAGAGQSSNRGASAFDGVNRGGGDARSASQRGQSSRSASGNYQRSGASSRPSGGGSRPAGGGSRGGGGGGGRGGGGRR